MLTFIIGFAAVTLIGLQLIQLSTPKKYRHDRNNMAARSTDIWRRDGADRKRLVRITEDQLN